MADVADADEAELQRQIAALQRAARMRALQAELATLQDAAATGPEEGGEPQGEPEAPTGRVTLNGTPRRAQGNFDLPSPEPTAKKNKQTAVAPHLPAELAAPFTVDAEQPEGTTLGDVAIKLGSIAIDAELQVTGNIHIDDATVELGALGELAVTVARVLVGHADYDKAALLGFVKPQLGHLMAVLQIDQGRVGKLAAVGGTVEIGQAAVSRMLDGTRVSHGPSGVQFTALAYKVAVLRWAEADITAAALGYEGELGKKKAAQPMAVAAPTPRWAGICSQVTWAMQERIKKLGGELPPSAAFPKRTEKDTKAIAKSAWALIKQDVDRDTADPATQGAYNLGEDAFLAEAPKYINDKWSKKPMKRLRDSYLPKQ